MTTKADIAEYTEAARDGWIGVEYDAAEHGLLTSNMHAAYCLGRHLSETGRCAPRDVRPGRGDTIRANDMRFRINWSDVKHPTFSREE